MPDSAQGNHPLNADLVDDALSKASRDGIRYCFTWNVRQFVLFDSHIQGVPFAQRHIEGPTDVVDATVSDDVEREWARDAIRSFWEDFLERFADLLAGRRTFEPSPIDQRFIGWLEGALEDPIAHTEDALVARSRTDSDLNNRLTSWMLSPGLGAFVSPGPTQGKHGTRLAAIVLHPRHTAGLLSGAAPQVQADVLALNRGRRHTRTVA